MTEPDPYATLLLLASVAALAAVLVNRVTARIRVPAPLVMLVGSAGVAAAFPTTQMRDVVTVEHVVTVCLVLILFDGGLHIGWRRFSQAAGPIVSMGVVGTFLTAAAGAVLLHAVVGMDWYLAVLVATAVAPTDPAVVFSILGSRQIRGRSSTILEGESGANDPVGIALIGSLIAAGALTWQGAGQVVGTFVLQMGVGAVVGVVGGRAVLWFTRRVPLPNEALYPLRTTLCAVALFGLGSVAHGSGFLAVFVAGIVMGDSATPYKREIERFQSAVASLGEITAFLVLGLTVDLTVIADPGVWGPGIALGVALFLVIRPIAAWICLAWARLRSRELGFVMFAGLKGAVPILLGELLRAAQVPDAERLYGIVVVVVVFSVLVQGSLLPAVVGWLGLPSRSTRIEPWALGVRLEEEPESTHRVTVRPGAPADGATVAQVGERLGHVWVSIVVREARLLTVRHDTTLRPGDELLLIGDPGSPERLDEEFARARPADG